MVRSIDLIVWQPDHGSPFQVFRIERHTFPDGERYQRLCTDVNERSVILVGGSISDESTLSLYDLACACVKYGARRLDSNC